MLKVIDPFHKWLPIMNSFASIKIILTNLILKLIISKEFLLSDEVREVNLIGYKIILNWQSFIKRVY